MSTASEKVASLEFSIDDAKEAMALAIEMGAWANVAKYALQIGGMESRLVRAKAPLFSGTWSIKS